MVHKNHSSSFSILFINSGFCIYYLLSLIILVIPFVAHLSAGPCSAISIERNVVDGIGWIFIIQHQK